MHSTVQWFTLINMHTIKWLGSERRGKINIRKTRVEVYFQINNLSIDTGKDSWVENLVKFWLLKIVIRLD